MTEEQNTPEQEAVEADLHYSWINYKTNSPEDQQDTRQLQLGGDTQFLHAEIVHYEDGSMALKLLSTGIEGKQSLVSFLESVHTIAQHDYLSSQKESRE